MEAPASNPPRPRRRRKLLWILASVVALLTVAIAVPVALLRAAPPSWRPLDAQDPALRAAAEATENRLTTETTAPRAPDEAWTLEITETQINAWLAVRLPMWLANQNADARIVDTLRNAQVRLSAEGVELAASLRLGRMDQIVRLVYRPVAPEGSAVTLELDRVYIGRLRVLPGWVVDRLRSRFGHGDARAADPAIAAAHAVSLRLPLEDGRNVRVIALKLTDGAARLTCRTEVTPRGR